MTEEQIFVGLDIGTTKIAAVVARIDEYGTLNIAGVGTSASQGLRRGVVINIEKTVNSIKRAIEQLKLCNDATSRIFMPALPAIIFAVSTAKGSSR
jgi:cell division protein FtsA